MTLPLYQFRVGHFVQEYGLETPVPFRLLDLTSEMGELAKEALKSTKYGQKTFAPNADFEGELGDVFFALVCIANSCGINLDHALDVALEKYERRLTGADDPSSGR